MRAMPSELNSWRHVGQAAHRLRMPVPRCTVRAPRSIMCWGRRAAENGVRTRVYNIHVSWHKLLGPFKQWFSARRRTRSGGSALSRSPCVLHLSSVRRSFARVVATAVAGWRRGGGQPMHAFAHVWGRACSRQPLAVGWRAQQRLSVLRCQVRPDLARAHESRRAVLRIFVDTAAQRCDGRSSGPRGADPSIDVRRLACTACQKRCP